MSGTNRLSLSHNYQANESSQISYDETGWHKTSEKHYPDRVNYMASRTQAQDSNSSVSMAQLDSQNLNNLIPQSPNSGVIEHDFQRDKVMQPQRSLATESRHQEYLYHNNQSPSTQNTHFTSNIYAKPTAISHYAAGLGNSSSPYGVPPHYGLEGNNISNVEDWKDKGAAVGVREDYDANGKLVLRQVKKGVRDFEFGRILGEGSYSQVVLGKDKQTLKEYAIKILDKKHIIREKKVKYVNIEKDTLNRLTQHPGIVRLYYTFQDSTSLYYVLDLASGGELLGVLKRNGMFDEVCTRFYGAQILDAIEHMHNRGVIHRDLKPENLLVDDQMHIKITDFGTAKLLPDPRNPQGSLSKFDASPDSEDSLRAKSFVGTAEYVSPELLTEKSACKASDLWAFGCIIYQLLAGRPPFKAGNDYQTFQKIVSLEYEFPPDFPGLARDLVERLLVLEPQKRLTIEHIKSHSFFEGIQWGRGLWKQKAPRIKPYVPKSQEQNILKLSNNRSNLCQISHTHSQLTPSQNAHTRPQPRVITQLPPPTQLDIEWSPVLTRNNERILKLGNLIVISSPLPISPNSRNGDPNDGGHEKRRLSRFFGVTTTKRKQRLVIVTSSGRIILAAAGGEEKKLKTEISLLNSDCSWRINTDSKGQETWCVYSYGTYYTFEDTKNSMAIGEPFRTPAQDWIDAVERAKEMAVSQCALGSYSSDVRFEAVSAVSSPNDTLIASSTYSAESISFHDRSNRSHLTKNQASHGLDESENIVRKSRFSKRHSKNGLSVPF